MTLGVSRVRPVTLPCHIGMTFLTIRIPSELAKTLDERRQNDSLNVSAFCRRAIERELARPVFDAEPAPAIERRNTSPVPVLFTPRKQAD